MKLPNGYGSVTKLPGNRRNPYWVRVSGEEKYDENLKDYVSTRISLGCFATKKAALAALAEYNENPYNPVDANITFSEIYKKYQKTKDYTELGSSALDARKSAFKHCRPLYDVKIRDINKSMLQNVLDSIQLGSSTKKNVLTVMRIVIDYAYDRNLISRKCYDGINIEYSEPVIDRVPFSKKEIDTLWNLSGNWDVKVLLILLYSGMRVNELLKNYRSNVNLDERWIYVPEELAKTKESARYIPIHNKIFDLVKWFYDNSEKYDSEMLMLNSNGNLIRYNNFVNRNLTKINQHLDVEHKFHDTRHTFASMGTVAGIPELYMQRLLGHKPSSILYNTYTHITVTELQTYMNMIN